MRLSASSFLCVVGLAVSCQSALAGGLLAKVADVEPGNNTIAGAPVVALGEQGRAIVFRATLTAGDTDIFRCNLGNNGQVAFITTPMGETGFGPLTSPDTFVSILDSAGATVIAGNDDDGCTAIIPNVFSFGSAVRFRAPTSGRYYVRVSGFNGDTGEYRASFALIPPDQFTCPGDADGNGVVNFADITNVLVNFNLICP